MATTIPGILSSEEQMKANYEKYRDKYKDSTDELVNSETFLNLMVAEMTNQDPLEPTSNTDFIAQLAQFTQLTYAQDSSKYSLANYATNLVGKIATGSKMDGSKLVSKTGVVESVTQTKDSYTVRIDGVDFDIKKVTGVKANDSLDGTTGGLTSNALANSIANAANMVGKYATVNVGEDGTKSGFIDSIKVKDGKITAVIADANGEWTIETPLDKIVEVTYATFVEEPDTSEGDKVEAGKLPADGEGTDVDGSAETDVDRTDETAADRSEETDADDTGANGNAVDIDETTGSVNDNMDLNDQFDLASRFNANYNHDIG